MRKRGFTLIEVVVSILIISIMSYVLIFKFNFVEKARFRNEKNQLLNDIYYIRQKAILSGVDTKIKFEKDSYKIYQTHNGNLETIDGKYRKLKYISLADDSRGNTIVNFNPSGSPSEATTINFIYKIGSERSNLFLAIGVGGSVRIYENDEEVEDIDWLYTG